MAADALPLALLVGLAQLPVVVIVVMVVIVIVVMTVVVAVVMIVGLAHSRDSVPAAARQAEK
jgi:hypothetical protein